MDSQTVDRLIGRIYTTFILRDATFLLAGGIVISVMLPEPIDVLADSFVGDNQLLWLAVVAFLALSYVSGVLLQEPARWLLDRMAQSYIRKKANHEPLAERTIVSMHHVYQAKVSEHTIHGIERLFFLRQVAATQLSALLAVLTILALRGDKALSIMPHWLGVAVVILLTVGTYLDKSLQIDDTFRQLTGKVDSASNKTIEPAP